MVGQPLGRFESQYDFLYGTHAGTTYIVMLKFA